jgi:hypothetical protein
MRKTIWLLGSAAAVALAMAAPSDTVVTCEGCGLQDVALPLADGERVDLSELQDGETRFFHAGDRQLIAARTGDSVALTLEGPEGEEKTFDCDLATTRCFVVEPREADGRLMILMERTQEGAADHEIFELALAPAGAGDGEQTIDVVVQAEGEGTGAAEHGAHHALALDAAGGTLLRCPEGDTTMRLGPGEEDAGPFRCPRHGIELEKAKGHVMVKEIRVQKPHATP